MNAAARMGPSRAAVSLLVHGARPPELGAELLRRLPPPFLGERCEPLTLELDELVDRQRGQLNAGRLLELLPQAPLGSLLALVEVDLFLPVLTYVFGASELGQGRSVLSLARLATTCTDPDQLLRRATIEAVHELGHGLGLVHCAVPACPMHRTLWPEAIDLKQLEPCPTCLSAIRSQLL